jgi:serine protease Do
MRVDLQKHSHVVIILLSVLVGMSLMAMLIYVPHETAARAQAAPGNLGGADWRTALSNVSDYVLPMVVSIQGKVKVAPDQEPDIQDFFRGMPGGPPGGPQRPPQPREHSFLGSGWIYSADGYIVTNAHVAKDAEDLRVQLHDVPNEEPVPATVIGWDARSDLAVIKVDVSRQLPYLTLGDSRASRVGEWVLAVGSPFSTELEQTVTKGIISAKGRVLEGAAEELGATGASIYDVIQTDASINPGNSGGPLVNLEGQVIGINESIISPGGPVGGNVGIGFAISSDMASRVLPQLIKNKKVVRGWLGIGIEALDENKRDFYHAPTGGALVTEINADGPSANSGLQVEDVIVKANGQGVHDPSDVQRVVAESLPGATVVLDVIRDGQPKQVSVKVGEMPENAGMAAPTPAPGEEPQAQDPLGLQVQTLSSTMPQAQETSKGVVVAAVDENGPAAGVLREGDIITRVDHTNVASVTDYNAALAAAKAAKEKYVILRIIHKEGDQVMPLVVDVTPQW